MNNPSDDKHFVLDSNTPLTEQQQAEIIALKAMSDESIDYSDIPPLTEKFWQNAQPNPFYKQLKTSTTMYVDSDILLWLKSKGENYQSYMNTVLRAEMQKEHKHRGLIL